MNERIAELARQSGIWFPTREDLLSNFAELIIRECSELTLDYKNDQHYQGWLDYRNEIKKHFGVES